MISWELNRILETARLLSTERNQNKLLDLILTAAMDITHADAGTLYLYDDDHNCLHFKILRNITLNTYSGKNGEPIDLPPVQMTMKNVCTYSAIVQKNINIPDVYDNHQFDFSGPKKYDKITGYHTQSILVIPLNDPRRNLVGVLQLINAQDEEKRIIPFSQEVERMITALASQAAVAITNNIYLNDIKNLLQSFIQVMMIAIEETATYNINHTRKVVGFTKCFIEYLQTHEEAWEYQSHFDDDLKEQLLMSAWMHDIGKIVIPTSVMNKASRLDEHLPNLMQKLDIAKATSKIAFLEGRKMEEEHLIYCVQIDEDKKFIQKINSAGFLQQKELDYVDKMRLQSYETLEGHIEPLLSTYEYECLSIVKGTLTPSERCVMQEHALMTYKLLDQIDFGKTLKDIPKLAAMHHEFLDGSGYPHGLAASHIPIESRVLTIIDIFEALTSADRPYKKPMSTEVALNILSNMANEGKLDKKLVTLFIKSKQKELY